MCDSFGLELRSNSEGLNPESPRTLHPHTVWSDISHGLSRCEGKGKSRRREEEGKGEVLLGRVNILETFSTLFKVKHGSLNANFLSGALSFHNRSTFFWIWSNIYRTYFFLTEIPCIIWELSDVGGWLHCGTATWKSWFMELKVFVKQPLLFRIHSQHKKETYSVFFP